MGKQMWEKTKGLIALSLLAVPPLAPFALAAVTGATPPTTVDQIIAIINKIKGFVVSVFAIAAVIVLFYAAFLYLTAGGDAEKVDKAKKQLYYAIIAIVIAVLAEGVPALIKNILT